MHLIVSMMPIWLAIIVFVLIVGYFTIKTIFEFFEYLIDTWEETK